MNSIFTIILITFTVIFLPSCSSVKYGDIPFIEMEQEEMQLQEQIDMCKIKPDSIFCTNSPSIGDTKPTYEYAMAVLKEMNSNFSYVEDNTWHYNDTVHERLVGDCEDISSTMAKHMIEDGVGKEYLYMVYRLTSSTEAHMFLAVDTIDKGLIHLDYDNSGYAIEDNINFYLPLDDVSKWIKGNIRESNTNNRW